MQIKNKKTVIAGLGETGYDTALFLIRKGAKVYVTEKNENEAILKKAAFLYKKGAEIQTGRHTEQFISGADIIIPSPGIPENSIPLIFARKKNLPVYSELELAYTFSPSKKIIAVTGTNGKTTTVSILGLIFRKAKLPSVVCGNIGNTFIGEIENITENTFVILEASSFQLEKTVTFKPLTGCLLNIDPDHIDRHSSFSLYMEAKKKMFLNQTADDTAIVNYDDVYCKKVIRGINAKILFFSQKKVLEEGIYLEKNKIISSIENRKQIFETGKIKLAGKGNNENIMVSILAAMLCKIDPVIIQHALYEFEPLPHRFEKIAEKKGVLFINDSKATNPHSVINALKSLTKDSKAILIMGGQNKDVSFSKTIPWIKKHAKLLIFLGESKEILADELKDTRIPHLLVKDMKEAVTKGAEQAKEGDTVLLAPGCASFDMFRDYKERGNVFKKEVRFLL